MRVRVGYHHHQYRPDTTKGAKSSGREETRASTKVSATKSGGRAADGYKDGEGGSNS